MATSCCVSTHSQHCSSMLYLAYAVPNHKLGNQALRCGNECRVGGLQVLVLPKKVLLLLAMMVVHLCTFELLVLLPPPWWLRSDC